MLETIANSNWAVPLHGVLLYFFGYYFYWLTKNDKNIICRLYFVFSIILWPLVLILAWVFSLSIYESYLNLMIDKSSAKGVAENLLIIFWPIYFLLSPVGLYGYLKDLGFDKKIIHVAHQVLILPFLIFRWVVKGPADKTNKQINKD